MMKKIKRICMKTNNLILKNKKYKKLKISNKTVNKQLTFLDLTQKKMQFMTK